MTRDKLVEIICDEDEKKQFEDRDYGDLADRILAALDQERKGEVVLASGEMGEDMMMEATCNAIVENGKKGQLIFREQEGK